MRTLFLCLLNLMILWATCCFAQHKDTSMNGNSTDKQSSDSTKKTKISDTLRYADMHAHVPMKAMYTINNEIELYKNRLMNYNPNDTADFNHFLKHIDSLNPKYEIKHEGWFIDENEVGRKVVAGQSGFIDYSQCNHNQLAQLPYSVVGASLCPPERFIVNGSFRLKINAKLVSKMDELSLRKFAYANSDFSSLLGEYVYMSRHHTWDKTFPGRKIKFVKNSAELDSVLKDHQTAMVFTIEGCHVLSNEHNDLNRLSALKNNGVAKSNWNECKQGCQDEVKFSIKVLKNLPHHLFFVEPGHFYWNNISGCPRSMDKPEFRAVIRLFPRFFTKKFNQGIIDTVFLKDYKLRKKRNFVASQTMDVNAQNFPFDFKRTNDGTPRVGFGKKGGLGFLQKKQNMFRVNDHLGWNVIKQFLDTANDSHKPTYIDLKHMDVQARVEYIHYVDSLNKTHPKFPIPLFVSHSACSGENIQWARLTSNFPFYDKYNELNWTKRTYKHLRNKYYHKVEKLNNPTLATMAHALYDTLPPYTGYFYPWGIGLYDEEIEAVYRNDGLIGIMLDERTLGFEMKEQKKYYKKQCRTGNFKTALNSYNQQNSKLFKSNKLQPLTVDKYINFEPFLRNLFYILNKSGYTYLDQHGVKQLDTTAWMHVAIGSDFDGFINPIDIVPTSADFKSFRNYIKLYFEFFCESNPHRNSNTNNDIWDERILCGKDYQELDYFLNKLFFINAEHFTTKYF